MDDYGSSAALYDRFLTPLLAPLRLDIRAFINHRGYRRIIDICCGTGDQLHLLENSAAELVGIDSSVSMLARARHNCGERVSLHLLDAEQLDFPAASFDCAILSFALHEKHQALRDLIFANGCRVVRQEGSVIVTDFSGAPAGIGGFFFGRMIMPLVERCAGRDHYLNYREWMGNGGFEGFLSRHRRRGDLITRRFGGSVLCGAVPMDDQARDFAARIALLQHTLSRHPHGGEP